MGILFATVFDIYFTTYVMQNEKLDDTVKSISLAIGVGLGIIIALMVFLL